MTNESESQTEGQQNNSQVWFTRPVPVCVRARSWVTGVGGGEHICVCENTCIHVHKDAKGLPWMTFLMSHPCYFLMQGLSLT